MKLTTNAMQHFFNTISESGQTLINFNSEAKSLEAKVYEVFKEQNRPLSWCDIYAIIKGSHEISIKRSISCLKKKELLEKTDELVAGIYGKNVHLYTLKKI